MQKYCVWQEQDIVSYRICTKNYECEKCQFEQMLADRNGRYVEPVEVVQEVERLCKLPTAQRRCKYVITGKVDMLITGCHGFCERGPLMIVRRAGARRDAHGWRRKAGKKPARGAERRRLERACRRVLRPIVRYRRGREQCEVADASDGVWCEIAEAHLGH